MYRHKSACIYIYNRTQNIQYIKQKCQSDHTEWKERGNHTEWFSESH